ncbi:Alpha-L-rhamnosidase rgxB [Colletotrichum orbiculare MAFF 240422]|uniref:Alpha-L-rhamnosidase rgxB n=1 Tax=Colletotrichum orbiculare (strain 104-T / ATCC 96160 / CBS 514.97 / LARS 414 / MAFF 240422) TaxID=1213857 RepID=N4W5J5_COLOR|nr:Alpha-L-rhamnosidase rgxB [Colletotrichum orbiculare MAFF 240422]
MISTNLLTAVLLLVGIVHAAVDLGPVQGLDRRRAKTTKCLVPAKGDGSDDTPAILDAFDKCKSDGHIVFENTTYHVDQVMKTTDLDNVRIDIQGTLLWSKNTTYWLQNSLDIGYQNQTAAWVLGGKNLEVNGFGHGTFDGNGQTWYDLVKGESNYPRRPHALLLDGVVDSVFQGLRFVQAQMWTVTIINSKRVLLQDIYVNNTSANRNPARNTDGANTLYSDGIHFRRWDVANGDDCIAAKANSTNILIQDVVFRGGQGVAVGSIGQYAGRFEVVENVTVRNVVAYGSRYVGRVKTWTGEQLGYPPNGGGAGLGYARNLSWDNVTVYNGEQAPIYVMQCITYNGQQGNCSTSLFDVSDISFANFRGTVEGGRVAYLQCSRSHGGCDGVRIENVDLTNVSVDPPTPATGYRCSNVNDPQGFEC